MTFDKEPDYDVGYRKPPRHSRFTKGQSGNPRGRPPGAKNLKTLLSEALNETVIVSENGGRRKVTKRQAIITQLVNRSATDDFRLAGVRELHPAAAIAFSSSISAARLSRSRPIVRTASFRPPCWYVTVQSFASGLPSISIRSHWLAWPTYESSKSCC